MQSITSQNNLIVHLHHHHFYAPWEEEQKDHQIEEAAHQHGEEDQTSGPEVEREDQEV